MVEGLTGRTYVLAMGALLATAAYFQADGVAQLVAARLLPSAPAPVARTSVVTGPTGRDASARDAQPILDRNPFDSVTGPIGRAPAASAAPTEPSAPAPVGDPYKVPACSGVKASLVTVADDPSWSFAALTSNGKSELRRTNDPIGSSKVEHIGWKDSPDPDLSARVWLLEGGALCIVEMGTGERAAPKKPVVSPTDDGTKSSKGKKSKLASEIESKIKKVGENRYEVERSGVEQIIQNYAKLAGSLRTRATKDGMKLSGVKPDSILGKLGMKNGDLMQSINGFDMSDPEKAVDAYAKLRSAGQLSIAIGRDGSSQTIEIQIVK